MPSPAKPLAAVPRPRTRSHAAPVAIACLLLCLAARTTQAEDKQPPAKDGKIRALLITGGCCHNYVFQAKAMQLAAAKRDVNVEWTVVNEGGKGTQAKIKLYDKENWAEGFDVVIHNECFANTKDPEYIRRITAAHKAGANAIVIHCAMHTYRATDETDEWRQLLGVTSKKHEHKSKYRVDVVAKQHPIMAGFPADYKTPMDELYVIEKVWPNAKVLATSESERTGVDHPVFWTNQYGKARVFGTTYGHSDETFSDEAFLNVLVRGIQWAAGK